RRGLPLLDQLRDLRVDLGAAELVVGLLALGVLGSLLRLGLVGVFLGALLGVQIGAPRGLGLGGLLLVRGLLLRGLGRRRGLGVGLAVGGGRRRWHPELAEPLGRR